MPTPVFLTGFEHGVVVTGAAPVPNARIWHSVVTTGGTPTTVGSVTGPHGDAIRVLNIPATAASASYVGRNTSGTPGEVVASFFVRFEGSLPTADCKIFSFIAAAGSLCDVRYQTATTDLRARVGSDNSATGVTVVADTWYRIDCVADMNSGTRTMTVQINGTEVARSNAVAASSVASWRIGKNTDTTVANGNIRFAHIVISETLADYPLGDHEVLPMALNGDGTHSFTANDFIRGDAGAAILTSDTDVWTLLDEVPFGAIGTTDSVQQNVIRSTGYVELALAAAPRAIDAWAIQIHGQYDADATGADTCTLKENDGGTLRDVYTNADVSNTTETFLTHCMATAPTGGAYTQAKLNALKLRWGFSTDVTGSPIVHALMVEAAYPVAAGPTIVEADGAAAGAATVTSAAVAIWNAVTAAAGLAASAVAGAALLLTVASAPGVATGAATSATVLSGSGASAGLAAASGVSALILPTQGASAGAASGVADGADGATGGQGVAQGTATATGVSSAIAGAGASAAAGATAVASSASVRPVAGASSGTAVGAAAGVHVLPRLGASVGTAAAAAPTAALAAAIASSAGVGVASAEGQDGASALDLPGPPDTDGRIRGFGGFGQDALAGLTGIDDGAGESGFLTSSGQSGRSGTS